MKTKLLYIFTRTPLHVGAGSSVGAIDQPIQRERHTGHPIIPGSSIKGVLRDMFKGSTDQLTLFGPESNAQEHFAGNISVTEARTLCFPVRSAKNGFAWLTSPLALQRYAREAGMTLPAFSLSEGENCLAASEVILPSGQVVLEEYCFKANSLPSGIVDGLKGLIPNDSVWATLPARLVIVPDTIFTHFCTTACEVQQRIKIEQDTGIVAHGALFNQENVPSETLFYAALSEKKAGGIESIVNQLKTHTVLQLGGDETVGLGFCTVTT